MIIPFHLKKKLLFIQLLHHNHIFSLFFYKISCLFLCLFVCLFIVSINKCRTCIHSLYSPSHLTYCCTSEKRSLRNVELRAVSQTPISDSLNILMNYFSNRAFVIVLSDHSPHHYLLASGSTTLTVKSASVYYCY